MKPKAAFVVSVARGCVISGILILLLPVLTGADSIWLAMPITELVVLLYAVATMKRMTKALAQEVAPRRVTVNAVAPGFIETDMTADLDEKSLKQLVPMRRFGKAEEVAELVGFLASEKAGYITGQCVSINGGMF